MAKSHDDFKDETDRKVREWHEKRAEEKRRPVEIMRIAGTPLPGGQPCREVLRLAVEYERPCCFGGEGAWRHRWSCPDQTTSASSAKAVVRAPSTCWAVSRYKHGCGDQIDLRCGDQAAVTVPVTSFQVANRAVISRRYSPASSV